MKAKLTLHLRRGIKLRCLGTMKDELAKPAAQIAGKLDGATLELVLPLASWNMIRLGL